MKRMTVGELGATLIDRIRSEGASREASLAITKVEEAMLWLTQRPERAELPVGYGLTEDRL